MGSRAGKENTSAGHRTRRAANILSIPIPNENFEPSAMDVNADYGYVGAGNGKVNLYKGRKMVRTAVPEEEAIGALREMIEGRS